MIELFIIDKKKFKKKLDAIKRYQQGCGRLFVVRLRGHMMKNFNELSNEFSTRLQFPHYYGNNWDAFDECIHDLEWLYADEYVIGIEESHLVLSEDDHGMRMFVEILSEAAAEDNAQPRLRVLLQVDHTQHQSFRRRLSRFGITPDERFT